MNHPQQHLQITSSDAHGYLVRLQAERALALDSGLAEVATYMAELDEEIAACRHIYVATGVTEIATLRAELSGPQTG